MAIVSSCLGGSAAAVTRYLVANADAVTLAILRWGIGFLVLLPVALVLRVRWPARADLPAVVALGLCFFGLFFVLYNIAVGYTTAARASLALSTLPLQTMLAGAVLGVEKLTVRKSAGVGIAMLGVFAALAAGISAAPPGAWRGELIMTGAVLCMALYNVWSRPFILRSSALGFLAVGMGAGAAGLVLIGLLTGRVAALATFGSSQWIAGIYLGVGGGALAFILWILALQRRPRPGLPVLPTVSDRGLIAGQLAGRRADHREPGDRSRRGVRGDLDRDDGAGQSIPIITSNALMTAKRTGPIDQAQFVHRLVGDGRRLPRRRRCPRGYGWWWRRGRRRRSCRFN